MEFILQPSNDKEEVQTICSIAAIHTRGVSLHSHLNLDGLGFYLEVRASLHGLQSA